MLFCSGVLPSDEEGGFGRGLSKLRRSKLERAGDVPRDRTGHEDAAGVFRPHLLPDMVQQPGRAGDIGVDHMGDVLPLLIDIFIFSLA